MSSSDQVAGHPIAIRVGGRRLSQSHPIRSPIKATLSSSSPSTSPEEATNVQQQPVVLDYPRPVHHTDLKPEAEQDGPAAEGNGGGGSSPEQANRKERRRQERKKDKYQTEEDKMHGVQRGLSFDNKLANKEAKGPKDKGKRQPSGTAGVRITQPVSKFMA